MYTYLVPTNQAWEVFKLDHPTDHQVTLMIIYIYLYMTCFPSLYIQVSLGYFSYKVSQSYFSYRITQLLERHTQVGAKLSLDMMVEDSREGRGVQVTRGSPVLVKKIVENGGRMLNSPEEGI